MKKIIIVIIVILCFLGGVFYSNFLMKRNQSIGEAKKTEYEEKFLNLVKKIAINTEYAAGFIEGISNVWNRAIQRGEDFNEAIRVYLEGFTHKIEYLKKNNETIQNEMRNLKDYPIQYQEAYNTLMDLYTVYSQIYSLALFPSGSLMAFNNKANELNSDFTRVFSKLKIYMPKLEDKPKIEEQNFSKALLQDNEFGAQAALKTIAVAEETWKSFNKTYASLEELGALATGSAYISADLASGSKGGYSFHLINAPYVFFVTAIPETPNITGVRSFCITEDGVIRVRADGGAINDYSDCRRLPPCQP